MMGWQEWVGIIGALISTLGSIILILVWYLFKEMRSDMRLMQKEVEDQKFDMVNNYAKSKEVYSTYEKLQAQLVSVEKSVNSMNLTLATFMAQVTTKGNHNP